MFSYQGKNHQPTVDTITTYQAYTIKARLTIGIPMIWGAAEERM